MRTRYSPWLLVLIGFVAFGGAILSFDIPQRMAQGAKAQAAMQMLDAMRRPLLAIKGVETRLMETEDTEAATRDLAAAAEEGGKRLARYREFARYNHELYASVNRLTQMYQEWMVAESHLLDDMKAMPMSRNDRNAQQHIFEDLVIASSGLLNTLNQLGYGEHFIQLDIQQGHDAGYIFFASLCLLILYLITLIVLQQQIRTRTLQKSHDELAALGEHLKTRSAELAEANSRLRQEIGERSQAQEAVLQKSGFVELLQAVTAAANEASRSEAAMQTALDRVCAHTGWPVGHVCVLENNSASELVPTKLWHMEDAARFNVFREVTEATRFPAGVGLPGRVLATGKPAWITDVTKDANFPRAAATRDIGVRAGFAFPVLIGAEVVAVLEFFSAEAAEPDRALLEIMAHIGAQLGRVIERKRAEERLQYLAHYDGLTGLPNRLLYFDRLDQALAWAHRNDQMVVVLLLDLDRFKVINDTLGHDVGDGLLQAVAERITACVREGDTVARLGGDEFVLLLTNMVRDRDVSRIAQKVLDSVEKPIVSEGRELFVTGSIGISRYPYDGKDAQALLKNADTAMYRAKEQGKNNFQMYSPDLDARAVERLGLESSLRHALEREEFLLHYQPRVNLRSGRMTGMEALLRWQHPELGLVSPDEFIPLLEETGLIVPVGEWVLRTACRQNKAWQQAGFPPLRVAVNLSVRQFKRGLPNKVGRLLKETGLEPRWLALEITESILMEYRESAVALLNELNAMGIRLVIDDFGTGYSSLSYLKRFPIHSLKIDRSFVRDIPDDTGDMAIARSVIGMAHSLNMTVTAEGVETKEQIDFLHAQNCDRVQGHYFSRPLPVTAFTDLLIEGRFLSSDVA